MENVQDTAWKAIIDTIRAKLYGKPRGEHVRLARELGVASGTLSKRLSGALGGDSINFEEMLHHMHTLGIDPIPFFAPALGLSADGNSLALLKIIDDLESKVQALEKLNKAYERIQELEKATRPLKNEEAKTKAQIAFRSKSSDKPGAADQS